MKLPLTNMATAQLQRLSETQRPVVHFVLNAQPAQALEGDTILTAILTQSRQLRVNEFSQLPRAGFCVMGACQDCWVRLGEGGALRACQHLIQSGMQVHTQAPLVEGAAGPVPGGSL